jgi:hypothetical protein
MAVALLFENPKVTRAAYDSLRQDLGVDETGGPDGGLLHAAGQPESGGWAVFEIWESRESARRFIEEELAPVFAAHGRPPPVYRIWDLHRVIHWD